MRILILIILHQINHSICDSLKPGGEAMLVLGVYQKCQEHVTSSSSRCQKTVDLTNSRRNDFWNYILQTNRHNVKNVISINDFEYQNLTFCTLEEAEHLVLDVILNSTYFVGDSIQAKPQWNGLSIQNWQKISKITSVLIYAEDVEISRFLSQLLSGQEFPVTFVSEESTKTIVNAPNVLTAGDHLNRNTERLLTYLGYGTEFKLNKKFIQNVAIIFIETDSYNYKEEFEDFFIEYKKLEVCFFFYTLNITDREEVDKLLHTLLQNTFIDFRILFGTPKDQTQFFSLYYFKHTAAASTQKTWIFFDLDEHSEFHDDGYLNQRTYTFNKVGLKYFSNEFLGQILVDIQRNEGDLTFERREKKVVRTCSEAYQYQYLRIIEIVHIYHKFNLFKKHKTFSQFKYHILRRSKALKLNYRHLWNIWDSKTNEFNVLKRVTSLSNVLQGLNRNMTCPSVSCGPGYEKYYGETAQHQGLAKDSYGWSCRLCPKGFYKIDSNDSTCISCQTYEISSVDRTFCYDAFTSEYLTLEDLSAKITLSICSFGSLFTLFSMTVFIKNRTTPIVKSSDFVASLQHLSLILALFITWPFHFIGKLSYSQCLFQSITIMLLSFCPSVIIYLKSQKILALFKAKTVLSMGQKRRSLMVQYSTAFVLILISISLLIASITFTPPKVMTTYDKELLTRRFSCNTGNHNYIQIALQIVLCLASTIQAYRGRHLPGPFNEALIIVYSTFLVVLVYTASFPIYFLQNDLKIKSVVHLWVVPIANLLLMIVFYGPKLYVILLQPEKNTKKHFQTQMMAKSQQIVHRKMKKGSA